jgi:hypothetical protein
MPKFYVTFGQGHPDRDGVVEIEAHNKDNAQNIAFKRFGNNWANIYDKVDMFGLDGGEDYARIKHFPRGIIN